MEIRKPPDTQYEHHRPKTPSEQMDYTIHTHKGQMAQGKTQNNK